MKRPSLDCYAITHLPTEDVAAFNAKIKPGGDQATAAIADAREWSLGALLDNGGFSKGPRRAHVLAQPKLTGNAPINDLPWTTRPVFMDSDL